MIAERNFRPKNPERPIEWAKCRSCHREFDKNKDLHVRSEKSMKVLHCPCGVITVLD